MNFVFIFAVIKIEMLHKKHNEKQGLHSPTKINDYYINQVDFYYFLLNLLKQAKKLPLT